MFPFFRKPPRRKCGRRAPRRFRLESLESRNCPSGAGLSVGVEAQTMAFPNVQVSGGVYGTAPGYSASLSGQVNANVAVTQSGTFSYEGAANGLGTITATATDSKGDTAQSTCTIMHTQPQITGFSAVTTGQGLQVELRGSISADVLSGLQVNFSGNTGLLTTSTSTDANGNFDLITTAKNLGSVTAVLTDDWAVQSMPITEQLTDSGPQISNLTVNATGHGKQVDVSGTVGGASPSADTVTFSGSAGVTGSATPNSSGYFNLVTNAGQLGGVSAVAEDVWGVYSSPANATLAVPAPYISGLTAINLGNGEWEFEGTVSGPDVTDDTVQLSGVVSAGATPNSNGTFSVVVQIAGTPTGTEYAVATDIWGQTSNQAGYTF